MENGAKSTVRLSISTNRYSVIIPFLSNNKFPEKLLKRHRVTNMKERIQTENMLITFQHMIYKLFDINVCNLIEQCMNNTMKLKVHQLK